MKPEEQIAFSLIAAYGLDEPLWVTFGRLAVKAVCWGFLVWWVTS